MARRLNAKQEREHIERIHVKNAADLAGALDLVEECESNRDADRKAAGSLACAWVQAGDIRFVLDQKGGAEIPKAEAMIYLPAVVSNAAWRHNASLRLRLPGYSPTDRTKEIANAVRALLPMLPRRVIAAAVRSGKYHTPREIGIAIGVTLEMRQRYKLWMVRPGDLTDEEFEAWRKDQSRQRDAERAARKRREQGAKRQDDSDSAIGRKYGCNRATIKRWREKGILAEKLRELSKCSSFVGTLNNRLVSNNIASDGIATSPPDRSQRRAQKPRRADEVVISADVVAAAVQELDAANLDVQIDSIAARYSDRDVAAAALDRIAAILKPKQVA